MKTATATVTRPATAALPQMETRRWFAQVIVPDCEQFGDRLMDGAVDIEVGAFEVGPGEVELARKLAEAEVTPLGCWVSSVWFEGGEGLEF